MTQRQRLTSQRRRRGLNASSKAPPIDDDELPPCIGERFLDSLHDILQEQDHDDPIHP